MLKTATTVFLDRILTCMPVTARLLGVAPCAEPAAAGAGLSQGSGGLSGVETESRAASIGPLCPVKDELNPF